MVKTDDLDALIAKRTLMNPDFPDLVKAELETRRLVLELASERERQGLQPRAGRGRAGDQTTQRGSPRAGRRGPQAQQPGQVCEPAG